MLTYSCGADVNQPVSNHFTTYAQKQRLPIVFRNEAWAYPSKLDFAHLNCAFLAQGKHRTRFFRISLRNTDVRKL
jgi:hypothetical protein